MIKEAIQKPEVSFWLAIIIPLLGFAIQWGVLSTKITACGSNCQEVNGRLDIHIEKAEANDRSIDISLTQIKVQLAEIKKDIQYIRTYK